MFFFAIGGLVGGSLTYRYLAQEMQRLHKEKQAEQKRRMSSK